MRPRPHMSHSPSSTIPRPPEVQAGMGLPACMPGCINSMPHQASLTLSGAVQVQTSASQIEITLGSYLRSGCHAQLLLLSCATLLRLPAVRVLCLSFSPCARKRTWAPSLRKKQGLASPSLQILVGNLIVNPKIPFKSVSGSRGAEDDSPGIANGLASDAQSSAAGFMQQLGSGEAEPAWNSNPMASSP